VCVHAPGDLREGRAMIRLSPSTAHRLIPANRWTLALTWLRIRVRRAEQLKLRLEGGRK